MRKAISHSSRWSSALSMGTPSQAAAGSGDAAAVTVRCNESELAGIEPRFLVDRLDQVLADAAFVLLMHLDQRPLPGLLLFRRQRDDLGLAGLPDGLEGIVVFLLGDVVGVLGGILHRPFEGGADVRRQPFPELLVDDDGIA